MRIQRNSTEKCKSVRKTENPENSHNFSGNSKRERETEISESSERFLSGNSKSDKQRERERENCEHSERFHWDLWIWRRD